MRLQLTLMRAISYKASVVLFSTFVVIAIKSGLQLILQAGQSIRAWTEAHLELSLVDSQSLLT